MYIYVCVRVCACAVVLQEAVCDVRDPSGGRGRRLGAVVALGGVQQDLWGGRVLVPQAL